MKEKITGGEWKDRINIDELVPQSVYKAAFDQSKVEARRILKQGKPYTFLVVEKDCPNLTDKKAWEAWQKDIKLVKQSSTNELVTTLPDAPEGVDLLHEVYSALIELNELSLSDRILLLCCFAINPDNSEKLFVGDYNGVKGKGIATEFYTQNLPAVARKLGVKFIIGMNGGKNISFFTDKLGRYTFPQLTAEAEKRLFPDTNDLGLTRQNWTIQFLEPELVSEYVREEEIKKM